MFDLLLLTDPVAGLIEFFLAFNGCFIWFFKSGMISDYRRYLIGVGGISSLGMVSLILGRLSLLIVLGIDSSSKLFYFSISTRPLSKESYAVLGFFAVVPLFSSNSSSLIDSNCCGSNYTGVFC